MKKIQKTNSDKELLVPAEPPTISGGTKFAKDSRMRNILKAMPKNTGMRSGLDDLAKLNPVIWTMYYRKLRGLPMTFDMTKFIRDAPMAAARKNFKTQREYDSYKKITTLRHRPFMIQPLKDQHPHKVYKKGRQIGISELSLTEALWFLWAHDGTKLIYTFPRDTQLKDFSATRIGDALNETPRMRSIIGTPNQVYLKRIGNSHMVLRSAWDSNLGEGVDADVVVLDEKDRMRPGVDIAFRESLSSSRFGYLREVSTPTLPNAGVDATWQRSDQMHWFVKCTKCGERQLIRWPDNIVQVKAHHSAEHELPEGTYEYACRKESCRGMLDRLNGEWVPRYPSIKNIRGYHMPQTIAVWISATQVMQKKLNYKFMQLWMNYVLGEVSEGEGMLLNANDYACADAGHQLMAYRTQDWSSIAIGIDWGHRNWVTVIGTNTNGRHYIIGIAMFEDNHKEELQSVKAIESFIAPFNPDIIVADAGYGKDRNAYLLRKFGEGRFYACHYNSATRGNSSFTPSWSNPETARVSVDRTMALKVLCRAIKEREFAFPSRDLEMVQVLESHFKNLSPLKEEADDGTIIETISAKGDDHLAHSTGYAWLGLDYLQRAGRFDFDFV